MTGKEDKMSNEDEISEAFRTFDSDGDGFITATELHNVMKNLGENFTEEEINNMVKEGDLDGDGHLNYEGLTKLF